MTWEEVMAVKGMMADVEMLWLRVAAQGRCVECGSYQGRSSCALGYGLRSSWGGLVCIDPWPTESDFQEFLANTAMFPIVPLRGLSHVAAPSFGDRSLDLVFLDTSHTLEQTLLEIDRWLPKIRPGGILCGHDFGHPEYPGIQEALNFLGLAVDLPAGSIFVYTKP